MGGSGHLAERGAELEAIEAALERGRAGSGSLMWIEGPAGIGKTTLLAAAAQAARAGGFESLAARCGELEQGLAFGAVRSLLERPLARDPERRARALSGAAEPAAAVIGERPGVEMVTVGGMHHALYWLLASLSDERPLLVGIDDFQWADPSSQQWLMYLTRRLGDLALVVVTTWRTGEGDEQLRNRVCDEPATVRLTPAPISPAAVAVVVRATLPGQVDASICEAANRASGGNPFLLAELLHELRDRQAIAPADVAEARPESVARGILRRLERMSPAAKRLADAAAILGESIELRHAAALAGLEQHEAVAAADELAAGAILARERPLRFEHPLVRAAVHDNRPLQARDEAHLQAARLLAADAASLDVIAAHLLRAPPLADPWVAAQLTTAGSKALARGAPREASELLSRALSEPPPAADRAALLCVLGRAELRIHDPRAIGHLEEAIELTQDSTLRGEAWWTLVSAQILGDDPATAERVLRAGIKDLAGGDREQQLRLRAVLTGSILAGYTPPEAEEIIASGQVEQLAGTTYGERLLLSAHSYWRFATSPPAAAAADLAERAFANGALMSGGELDVPNIGMAPMVLSVCDRVDAAAAALEALTAAAQRSGSLTTLCIAAMLRCNNGWLRGKLADAEADGRIALAIAQDLPPLLPGVAAYLARALVDRGAPEEADALLACSGALIGERTPFRAVHWIALAHLRQAQGRLPEAAESALTLATSPIAQLGASCAVPWRLQAAIALAALDKQARARHLLAEQRQITERWEMPRARGLLERAEGLVEARTDRLEAAVETLRATPARLEHARTLIDLGAMRRRARHRVEARVALRAGLDLAHRCDANQLVAQATEELAACGSRPRNVLLTGIDSLTASEQRVARLAAEGLSNRVIAQQLYVSSKTVETHLAATYRKLDINSREQLPQALAGIG